MNLAAITTMMRSQKISIVLTVDAPPVDFATYIVAVIPRNVSVGDRAVNALEDSVKQKSVLVFLWAWNAIRK